MVAESPSPGRNDRRRSRHLDTLMWLIFVLALALAWRWPRLDLWVDNRFFYRPGRGFFDAQLPWVVEVYRWTPRVGYAALAACALVLLIARWRPASVSRLVRRTALGVLLSALLSSGLLIDNMLKPWWGRPRPVQVMEFGGSQPYHPPLQPCAHCGGGYSFVSGHAAVGFTLMSLGLCCSATWRRRWLGLAVLVGSAIGWARMAQGGHFLSDVVFAFFAVWICNELVRWAMHRGDNADVDLEEGRR